MHRTPEPELMDAPDQALAYAQADFSSTDAAFVAGFFERFGADPHGPVLDLGCGPGNICRRIALSLPRRPVVGVDGAGAMIALARAEAPPNLRFIQATLPFDALPRRHFAAVVSNSLLHHLHDPDVLWRAVAQAGLPAAAVFIADLRRPTSEAEVDRLVATHAAHAPDVLRRDFQASLRAAFEPEEIRAQLERCGLGNLTVQPRGDRHVWIWGRLKG